MVVFMERDRIPFILGVNPLHLLWRFLKHLLGPWAREARGRPLGPLTLHLFGLKLGVFDLGTVDVCLQQSVK